jgi:Mg2+ and Co2+ transporter CorA
METDSHRSTNTAAELTTHFRKTSVRVAAARLDDSVDSIERAQEALRLYQEHLERTNDPMFNRKKKELEPEPINWQAQTPAQDIKAHVPSMAEQLRKRREDKVQLANQLDEDIMALDHEITWLERHPGSEYVIKEFVRRHEEEVQQAKDRPSPPRY